MVIKLPAEVEHAVRGRAAAAGFGDVDEYVLSLVHQDQELSRWEESAAQESGLEALALDGLASGPVLPLDMDALRRTFRERRKLTDEER